MDETTYKDLWEKSLGENMLVTIEYELTKKKCIEYIDKTLEELYQLRNELVDKKEYIMKHAEKEDGRN